GPQMTRIPAQMKSDQDRSCSYLISSAPKSAPSAGHCLSVCAPVGHRPVYSAGSLVRNPSEYFTFAASQTGCGNGETDGTSTGRRVSTWPSAKATLATPAKRNCVAFTP